MKQYDVKCPLCGALNKNVYLEETDGFMECCKCGLTVLVEEHSSYKWYNIPVVELEHLAEYLRLEEAKNIGKTG